MVPAMPKRWKSLVAATVVATFAWWSSLAFVFDAVRPSDEVLADQLQRRLTSRWLGEHVEVAELERSRNPEWDFMARTFISLALINDALAEPSRASGNLAVVDRVIADTIVAEREYGQRHFLLPYAGRKPFADPTGRSVFVDGEIALMLAARAMVSRDDGQLAELERRVAVIESQMRRGPALSAESYPDEAWTFCNSTALVALAAADHVLGTDHRSLTRDWVEFAKAHLVDDATGLLISSYTYAGEPLDGPEGSTLWMTVHNLRVLDPEFARVQYALAKEHLRAGFGGFAWAREWPSHGSFATNHDVDSGAVVPLLGASPGSSGMMLIGAAAFDDRPLLGALLRTLALGAFPITKAGATEFAATGVIGNAVVLYALRFGPLWERLSEQRA